MNGDELVFVEGIGSVRREVLLRNPELLSHEQTMQRRHEQWLADLARREREKAELEEDERAFHEIEGDAPISIHRHSRRKAEPKPPNHPKTRSEAGRDDPHGEPDPHPSEAKTGTFGRFGTLSKYRLWCLPAMWKRALGVGASTRE